MLLQANACLRFDDQKADLLPRKVVGDRYDGRVNVLIERQEELEKHEFMMGVPRGRLAVTLDVLTDALVLVGQHGVYCQSARQPGKPAMDIQIITKQLVDAKDLISSVMAELKVERASKDPLLPGR